MAFNLLTRRSWKHRDQIRLPEHYLARLPFAAAKPYGVFLSFMAADVFVAQLRKFLASDESKAELLRCHSEVVMRDGSRLSPACTPTLSVTLRLRHPDCLPSPAHEFDAQAA